MSILENMYKASFLIAKYPKENAYRTIPSRTNGPVNAHLIPSFVEISLSVPEKKTFEGFLPYI